MPITCEFEYHKPKSLPEAIEILSRNGKNASVLAGGTDLLVWMKEGLRAPSAVVDVKGIRELHSLEAGDGTLVGNICSAVPCLDSAPALLAYEASVLVEGPEAQRQIPVARWFLGAKQTA